MIEVEEVKMSELQKENLLIEFRQLAEKKAILESFLSRERERIQKKHLELLEHQLNVMIEYSLILQERLFMLLKGE